MDGRPRKMSGGSTKRTRFPEATWGDQKNAFGGGATLGKYIVGLAAGGEKEGHGLVVSRLAPSATQGHVLF